MPITWSNFPVKSLILAYLDLEARCNLRVCSKADKDLVDSSKFVPKKMLLTEMEGSMDPEKTIIRLDIDTFTIWFIGKNEKTRIERAWNEQVMEMAEIKNENRYDIFRRFIDRFLKNGTFEAQEVNIMFPTFGAGDHWTIKTSNLFLASPDPGRPAEWCLNWLRKVAPGTKLKELTVLADALDGIAELPLVYDVTEKLHMTSSTDFGDEHLDRIKAKDLRLATEEITEDGLKRALERFLHRNDPNCEFTIRTLFPEDFDPVTLIPEDVKFEKIEHEEFFGGHVFKLSHRRMLRFSFHLLQVFPEPKRRERDNHIMWPF